MLSSCTDFFTLRNILLKSLNEILQNRLCSLVDFDEKLYSSRMIRVSPHISVAYFGLHSFQGTVYYIYGRINIPMLLKFHSWQNLLRL